MRKSRKKMPKRECASFRIFSHFFVSFSWFGSSFSTFGFIFFPGFHLFEFPVSSFLGSGFIFLRLSEVQVLEQRMRLFCSSFSIFCFIFFSLGFHLCVFLSSFSWSSSMGSAHLLSLGFILVHLGRHLFHHLSIFASISWRLRGHEAVWKLRPFCTEILINCNKK